MSRVATMAPGQVPLSARATVGSLRGASKISRRPTLPNSRSCDLGSTVSSCSQVTPSTGSSSSSTPRASVPLASPHTLMPASSTGVVLRSPGQAVRQSSHGNSASLSGFVSPPPSAPHFSVRPSTPDHRAGNANQACLSPRPVATGRQSAGCQSVPTPLADTNNLAIANGGVQRMQTQPPISLSSPRGSMGRKTSTPLSGSGVSLQSPRLDCRWMGHAQNASQPARLNDRWTFNSVAAPSASPRPVLQSRSVTAPSASPLADDRAAFKAQSQIFSTNREGIVNAPIVQILADDRSQSPIASPRSANNPSSMVNLASPRLKLGRSPPPLGFQDLACNVMSLPSVHLLPPMVPLHPLPCLHS